MRPLEFLYRGKLYFGWAAVVQNELWCHVNGRTFVYESPSAVAVRRHRSQVSEENQIVAPMPGRIVDVYVKKGQSIAEGERVATLEAMKMEYNLTASVSGVVMEVRFGVGDQVKRGEVIAEIESKTEPQ